MPVPCCRDSSRAARGAFCKSIARTRGSPGKQGTGRTIVASRPHSTWRGVEVDVTSSTKILPNRRLDVSTRNRPQDPPALHAVAEEHEQRNAARVVLRGEARILVDVELSEADVASLAGQLLDDRRDHPAGAAPRGPEADQPRAATDVAVEIRLGQRHHAAGTINR